MERRGAETMPAYGHQIQPGREMTTAGRCFLVSLRPEGEPAATRRPVRAKAKVLTAKNAERKSPMNGSLEAALRSWPFEPWLLASLALGGAIYWRGWRSLRSGGDSSRMERRQAGRVLGGLGDDLSRPWRRRSKTFSTFLLSVHMTQHILLMIGRGPPVALARESRFFPMLRGVPRPVRTVWLAPLFSLADAASRVRLGEPSGRWRWALFIAVTWPVARSGRL